MDQDAIDRAVRAALVEERQRFNAFRTEADKRFRWITGNVARLERVFASAGEIVEAMRSDDDWDKKLSEWSATASTCSESPAAGGSQSSSR